MVSSGVWVRMLRRSGRLLMAEPLFAAVAPFFSKFRRFFEWEKTILLRKIGAFSFRRSYWAMFARVLAAD